MMPSLDRHAWIDRAACKGADPTLFFPGVGDTTAVTEAKKICAGCPVRTECLDYALSLEPPPRGIWGGETINPRKRLARTRAMPTLAAAADAFRHAPYGESKMLFVASTLDVSRRSAQRYISAARRRGLLR